MTDSLDNPSSDQGHTVPMGVPVDGAAVPDEEATVGPGTGGAAGVPRRRIGHYVIEQEIGRGGQGFVYLARDSRLQRRVALKVLSAAMAFSPEARARFEREAEIASRLDHPGLCTVHEIGEDAGIAYIAMQFVDGESLGAKIKHAREAGSATEVDLEVSSASLTAAGGEVSRSQATSGKRREMQDVIELVEGVARALHEAHESGLVHRDIKPGNIMVTSAGQGVLLDFGLATAEDIGRDFTQTGFAMGTPTYMPPEQIRGEWDRVDRRADVYALGITLFECLTLERPFVAPTLETLVDSVVRDRLPDPRRFNSRVPLDLKVVLETATEKDPNRRYATALDFAEELRRVRSYEPVKARRASAALRCKRWVQRNPVLATSLTVIFLIMTVALVLVSSALREKSTALDEKDAAVRDYERMADAERVSRALAEAEELWPARPRMRDPMRRWLERSRPLAGSLAGHRVSLEAVRSAIAAGIGDPDLMAWKGEVLDGLVSSLERLTDSEDGVIAAIERRLARIDEVERRTVVEYAAAWQTAVTAIAGSDRYDGLAIRPIVGLIPLGADPATGLHEFLDFESHAGPLPRRDDEGMLELEEDTGIVLVLIPGARFVLGRSPEDEVPHLDERVGEDEVPPHEIALDPFLLSKYELTRGQWRRLAGTESPSHWTAARAAKFLDPRLGLLPVENVSWDACVDLFGRFQMTLPTEAQWEYAARAGTDTQFYFGTDAAEIDIFENTADSRFRRLSGGIRADSDHDDGYGLVAPVGQFEANPFGLHDILGNVGEWCLCRYGSYELPVRPGTGERIVEDPEAGRVQRGGSYAFKPVLIRIGDRSDAVSSYSVNITGVRPAMLLSTE